MENIGIKDIQSYIPEKRLTNEELCDRLDVDSDFLYSKLGISTRSIAGSDEVSSDLAVKSAEKLFTQNRSLQKEAVDLLIVVTQNPDYKLPHTSALVQDRLGLGEICAFDINLGCSGFIYALAVAKSMLSTLGFKNAIIITADTYSKVINPLDKNTVTLFGDAGAAIWLAKAASNRLLEFTLSTDGAGHKHLIIEKGGSRFPLIGEEVGYCSDSKGDSPSAYLHMDGRKIYNFMMKTIPSDIKRCLELSRLTIEQIDYFVFHQASKFMIESLGARLNIPKEKLILKLSETGNTVSSSIPLALEDLMHKKDLNAKNVLISGFGVGLSWGTNIISFYAP